jgi:hypothetical protein
LSSFAEIANSTDPFVVGASVIEIRDKAHLLRWVTLGIGSSFLVLALINFFMYSKYNKIEEDTEVQQDAREVAFK